MEGDKAVDSVHREGLSSSRDILHTQELQRLSSECVRLCDRVRAKLDVDACKAMDQELGDIASLFDLKVGVKGCVCRAQGPFCV